MLLSILFSVLFEDTKIADQVMKTNNPRQQKGLGRKVSNFKPGVWKEACIDIVKRGNYAKVILRLI